MAWGFLLSRWGVVEFGMINYKQQIEHVRETALRK